MRTVAQVRDDYRAALVALGQQRAMLLDVAAQLQRLVVVASEQERAAEEAISAAESAAAAAEADMADAEDDDAYVSAEAVRDAALAAAAAAKAELEVARALGEEATRRLLSVQRAIALTGAARMAVSTAVSGLRRHAAVEEAVAGHPGVAERTAAYAGDSR